MINLSIVLEHRSDLSGAEALLLRAAVIAPGDARVHEYLGHIYLDRNELGQAQAEIEQAVSLSPSDARLHFMLGQVYRRQGLDDKAKAEFARFAAMNGTHSTPDYPK
jgi:Flp pilus assembly protein TadD